MTSWHVCTVWLDLGEGWRTEWPAGEAEYRCHFYYSPGRPGKMYLRNGDPGYPDEPPELYITDLERNGVSLPVIDENGDGILSDEQYESAESQVSDWIEAQEEAEMAARYEI